VPGDHDPAGWWMSEKLDGVRAYWDGKQFLSRNNNIFYAPEWFTEGLPGHQLDGELWVARKKFNFTSGPRPAADQVGRLEAGQVPSCSTPPDAGGPFEDRMKFLADALPAGEAEVRRGSQSTSSVPGSITW